MRNPSKQVTRVFVDPKTCKHDTYLTKWKHIPGSVRSATGYFDIRLTCKICFTDFNGSVTPDYPMEKK